MQIWTRLTFGFAATAIAIVGLYGVYQLRVEEADLRRAAERDMRGLASALQVATDHAIRDDQPADIRQLLDAVKAQDPLVDVMFFDQAGAVIAATPGSGATAPLAREQVRAAGDANRIDVAFDTERGFSHAIGIVPGHDVRGHRAGTLTVVRQLEAARLDLASETRAVVVSMTALAAGLTTAGWLLATVYVRRPLIGLLRAIRAVRAGDLGARATYPRADELGAVVAEFNTMTRELIDARGRLVAESARREELEATLLRADKMVTVGQLSAGLAHEIGSPLQVLGGRARELAARDGLPRDVTRIAEILARETDRIARIVEQLLVFSRQRAYVTNVSLGAPLRDIVELLQGEAQRKGVRLTFACAEPLPEARVDATQIQQVAMNLVRNALRATPSGGEVRLQLDRAPDAPDWLHLVVEDTGEGIPSAILPRIFEPFFTTAASADGTGLGLAVVKSIVDAHGGTIAVTTATGQGTRFVVTLPTTSAVPFLQEA